MNKLLPDTENSLVILKIQLSLKDTDIHYLVFETFAYLQDNLSSLAAQSLNFCFYQAQLEYLGCEFWKDIGQGNILSIFINF